MAKYQYVLFDLDGTLLDTSAGILNSIDETIQKCGLYELDDQTKASIIGPPIQHSLQHIYGLSDAQAAAAAEVFRSVYKEKYLMDAVPYLGMEALLASLREHGVKTGVATYKRDDYAQTIMSDFGITDLCDYALGSDAAGKMKKADIIRACMEALGCENPRDAVYVGDTPHDADGARGCDMDFIAVTFGFGFPTVAEAEESGAVAIFDSVPAVGEFLLGNK